MSMWTEWFKETATRRELKSENLLPLHFMCSVDFLTTEADTEEEGGGGGGIERSGGQPGCQNERENHPKSSSGI